MTDLEAKLTHLTSLKKEIESAAWEATKLKVSLSDEAREVYSLAEKWAASAHECGENNCTENVPCQSTIARIRFIEALAQLAPTPDATESEGGHE